MNRLFFILFFGFVLALSASSQDTLVLQGHCYDKNLYVINPTFGTDTSFCIKKVLVNGQPSKDEINSNSFEIDFSLLNITTGAAVKIQIFHDKGCKPKVINPEVLQTQGNFIFLTEKVDKIGKLLWTIKGDPNGSFTVEQFRWKKWVTAGEIDVMDTVRKGSYSFDIKPHFGLNTFRISNTDEKGNTVYSKPIKYKSPMAKELSITSSKVTDEIDFTGETAYEVYDEAGNFITDGYGDKVSVKDLPKGKYWVNYDDKTAEMVTKK